MVANVFPRQYRGPPGSPGAQLPISDHLMWLFHQDHKEFYNVSTWGSLLQGVWALQKKINHENKRLEDVGRTEIKKETQFLIWLSPR